MTRLISSTFAALAVALLSAGGAAAGEAVTLEGLLHEMSSLEWLSRAMPSGTRHIQFSSYDRSSKVEDGQTVGMMDPSKAPNLMTPSAALGWWANKDLGNYLRQEETSNGVEYVMAEAEGPGVLTRLWSANPGGRVWRIYIDGSDTPVIEEKGKDLLGGRVEPFGPAFAGRRSMGGNFIFPVPFSKSVKVTVSKKSGEGGKGPMMYYQVNLRMYPEGTEVEPFSMDSLAEAGEAIEKARSVILDPDSLDNAPGLSETAEVSLAPGAKSELFSLSGEGSVRLFKVELFGKGEDWPELLARTELAIDFDGTRAVRAPLGDFFGSSPGVNDIRSLPFTMRMTPPGAVLTCRWVMPFQSSARVSLHNMGGERLRLRATLVRDNRPWDADSLYFRADWRQWRDIETRPFHDLRMAAILGRGHFVGLEMNVRNPMEYFWWGEGDEKVRVDGEEFPSIFGTGTEDYFGYAWCVQYLRFSHAYHGITVPTREWLVVSQATPVPYFWEWLSNSSARSAIVSQYRFQVLDAIPFGERLAFDMELWHHRDTSVDVNAVSYWYAAPGSADDAESEDLSLREVWAR